MLQHHIYHHNDLDGRASAAIIALYLERYKVTREHIHFYEMSYGMTLDDSKVDYANDQVYMVDFSLQPNEQMIDLMKKCQQKGLDTPLCWIDHHQTSVNFLEEVQKKDICYQGIIKSGKKAGCMLTWEYFFKGVHASEALQMLSQYDVWDEKGKCDWMHCKQLQLGMYASENDPKQDLEIWKDLLINKDRDQLLIILIKKGEVLLNNNEKRQKELGKLKAYKKEFAGYNGLLINHAEKGSSIFEVSHDISKYDIMVSYCFTKGKYWTVSIYSVNPEIDCGALCKQLGHKGPLKSGGGHKGAAGFQTSTKHMMELLGE